MAKKGMFVKRGAAPVRKEKRPAKHESDDENDDEIDKLSKAKDKILLNREEESEGDEGSDEVEAVHDLDLGSDEEDSDADDAVADSDDEEDADDDAAISKRWGKSKGQYYSTDVVNEEDLSSEDDAAELEEEEVKALQKKKALSLTAADFDDEVPLGERVQLAQAGVKKPAGAAKGATADLDFEDGTAVVEKVTKDISKLTTEQKLEIVMNESPELLDLLEEFKTNIVQVRDRIKPILDKVQTGQLPTSNGLSYLQVKFHLLLSYCTNIAFYLLLKAEGKSVKDHPVIDQLVKIRTYLEKMRPLDQKLKYQVDKLLKLALEPAGAQSGDLRSHRPDLSAFLKPGGAADENGADEGEGAKASNEAYRPSHLSAHLFDEKTAGDRLRKQQRLAKRLAKSKMLQEIRDEFGDAPTEQAMVGGRTETMDEDEIERQQYEESMMLRTMMSKTDKRKQKQKGRVHDELKDLMDIGNYDLLTRGAELEEEAQREDQLRSRSMRRTLADLDKPSGGKKASGDADIPRRDPEHELRMSQRRQKHTAGEADDVDDGMFDFSGGRKPAGKAPKANGKRAASDDVAEDEDDFYKETQRQAAAKKQKKAEPTPAAPRASFGELSEGDKRAASKTIMKNRGLVKSRNRDLKNPRARARDKFEKALKKQRGMVRKPRTDRVGYGGEQTGIKANVKRSVPIF